MNLILVTAIAINSLTLEMTPPETLKPLQTEIQADKCPKGFSGTGRTCR